MKTIRFALVLAMAAPICCGAAFAQTFSKTASPSSGTAPPLAVTYTYTFDNTQGAQARSVDTPTDTKCSPVVFGGGDSNNNQVLDVGEVWSWTCSAVVNATTTNTAQTGASFTKCYDDGTCTITHEDFITARATVTLPAPLSVSISGPQSVCKNDLATLTAVAAGGTPPYTFVWTNGQTSQALTPNTSAAGTFPFGVTVTDQLGATASANTTLTVALICLTNLKNPVKPPDFPLLTTIKWGCGFSFGGHCFTQTIVQICVGGHCFDNPRSPDPRPCRGIDCVLWGGIGIGIAGGLVAGVLLGRRGGNARK